METYTEFLNRINAFEKPQLCLGNDRFTANPSLTNKVAADNTFKNFYGDTVVFALDDRAKTKLARYADALHKTVPQCFCQALKDDTFHVTLHDLSNSAALSDIAEELFYNELGVAKLGQELKRYADAKIVLKSKYVFNMVNTSIVFGLYPSDENSHKTLTSLYSVFDSIKKLSYPLTPHITLAYYNVNGFDTDAARALESAVNGINSNDGFQLTLNVKDLRYQKFTSMNDYVDIIDLAR